MVYVHGWGRGRGRDRGCRRMPKACYCPNSSVVATCGLLHVLCLHLVSLFTSKLLLGGYVEEPSVRRTGENLAT